MRGSHGAEPTFEKVDELVDPDARPRRVASDRLDNRQRVLDAVIELPQQQLLPALPVFPLADVAGNLRGADDLSVRVAYGRHGERNLDETSVLAATHGIVVVDFLAHAEFGKNPGHLLLPPRPRAQRDPP